MNVYLHLSSACTHAFLPVCLYTCIHMPACLPVHMHVCLPVCLPPSLTMSPLFSGPHSCFRLKFSITASRSTIPFRGRQRHRKTGTHREEVILLGTLLRLLHLSDHCALDQKISIPTESLPSRLLGQCCNPPQCKCTHIHTYALPITVSEASATPAPPTSNNSNNMQHANCFEHMAAKDNQQI